MVDATPIVGPSKPVKSRHASMRARKAHREQVRLGKTQKIEEPVVAPSVKGKEKAIEVPAWPLYSHSAARASECPVLYSKDGHLAFVPDTVSVRIYRTSTAQLLSRLVPKDLSPDAHVTSLLLNPSNDLQLYIASSDGRIRVWDYSEGKQIRILDLGHSVYFLRCDPTKPGTLYFVARGQDKAAEKGKGQSSDRVYSVSLQKNGTALCSQPRLIGKLPRVTGLELTFDGAFLIATCIKSGGIHIASQRALDAEFLSFEGGHQFTALAAHPSELSFATGDSTGRIHIWYPFDDALRTVLTAKGEKRQRKLASVASQTFHWHAHAVATIAYMPNGAYLASGGEESVLVLWQLASGHREYVPRLGAQICSISLSSSGHEFAVTLADASVLFVDAQGLTPRRSIASVKIDANGYADPSDAPVALAFQPGTSILALNSSHPSSLQFFSLSTASHLHELEVSPTARFSRTEDVPIEPARVEQVAFSQTLVDGTDWMATIDTWKAKHYAEESFLKIWRKEAGADDATWSLDTRIDHPHGSQRLTGLIFAPSTADLATCGFDEQVRIWHCSAKAGWRCRLAFAHRNMTPCGLAWSADGSVLAVAYKASVVLFDVSSDTAATVATFACSFAAPLSHVAFAGRGNTVLVAAGESGLQAWDVLTGAERLRLACRASILLARHGADTVVALETLPVSETRPQSLTTAFTVDLEAITVDIRQLSCAVRQAVFVDSKSPTELAIAVISEEGGLALVGDGARPASQATAVQIDGIASLQNPSLFDDLFGRRAEQTKVGAAAQGKTEKLALSELFEAPSHVLPPLPLLWRSLLSLPPKKSTDVQLSGLRRDEDAMQVDGSPPPAQEGGPTKLPVYEHDLGKMLGLLQV